MVCLVRVDDGPRIAHVVDPRDRRIEKHPIGTPMLVIIGRAADRTGQVVDDLVDRVAVRDQCDAIVRPAVALFKERHDGLGPLQEHLLGLQRPIVPAVGSQIVRQPKVRKIFSKVLSARTRNTDQIAVLVVIDHTPELEEVRMRNQGQAERLGDVFGRLYRPQHQAAIDMRNPESDGYAFLVRQPRWANGFAFRVAQMFAQQLGLPVSRFGEFRVHLVMFGAAARITDIV